MERLMVGALVLLGACAGSGSKSSAPAHPGTRYRVGDSVVYRYQGTFSPVPVVLTEQVVRQEGNRLELQVSAERGPEKRAWVMVLTDTPENQKNNVIDELYELVDGQRQRLANADVYRLFQWTFLEPEGKSTVEGTQPVRLTLGGVEQECQRTTGTNASYQGKPVRWEQTDCPGFLWTHAQARFWREDPPEEVYRMDVERVGKAP